MRINGALLFAPGIRFDQADLQGDALPAQYRQRMAGFYIEPAVVCADHGHAFAAGTLLVACIDGMVCLRYCDAVVRHRFIKLAQEDFRSFRTAALAARFYEDFRNGLVHEGRVKNGGQFSLEVDETVRELQGLLLINPSPARSGSVRGSPSVHCSACDRSGAATGIGGWLVSGPYKGFHRGDGRAIRALGRCSPQWAERYVHTSYCARPRRCSDIFLHL